MAYAGVRSSSGTSAGSQVRTMLAADSTLIRSMSQGSIASRHGCHQPGMLAALSRPMMSSVSDAPAPYRSSSADTCPTSREVCACSSLRSVDGCQPSSLAAWGTDRPAPSRRCRSRATRTRCCAVRPDLSRATARPSAPARHPTVHAACAQCTQRTLRRSRAAPMVSMSVPTDHNAAERCHRLSHSSRSTFWPPRSSIDHTPAHPGSATSSPAAPSPPFHGTAVERPAPSSPAASFLAPERPRAWPGLPGPCLPGPAPAPNSTVPYARTLEPAS
ncbi:protein of unknown function [Streptomyces sp. KY70]|nr:protein of unknown function [Streptomyces sp. KY70]